MLKRLLLISLVLASLAAIAYTLWDTSHEEQLNTGLMHHIAPDAIMILEVDDAEAFHAKLQNGNVLWPDLGDISWTAHLQPLVQDIDSLMAERESAGPDSVISYAISLHPSGQADLAWTFTTSSQGLDLNVLVKRIEHLTLSGTKDYQGSKIYQVIHKGTTLSACIKEGMLHVSTSSLCIEAVLRDKGLSPMDDVNFVKSLGTRGNTSPAHLHCNWSVLGEALNGLIPNSSDAHMREQMGQWSTADLISDANSIYLHGLIQAKDAQYHHLARYASQGSGAYDELLQFIPRDASTFSYHHITDPAAWSIAESIPERMSGLASSFGEGILLASFASEEASVKRMAVIPLRDAAACQSAFETSVLEEESILGRTVWKGMAGNQFEALYSGISFGSALQVCIIDEHLILSTELSLMEHVIVSHETERVLANDAYFEQLNDDMDTETSICHYVNLSQGEQLLKQAMQGSKAAAIAQNPEALNQFQAFVVQYEPASEGLFHQNILLRHNPQDKRETSSLWEATLDTTIRGAIHPVLNHHSKQKELLVETVDHRLHMIANTGKTRWTVDISGPIRSDIHQIDVYKNNKLQILFNTNDHIYLIDRNGNPVEGYPIALPDSASSRLAVLDYDSNKNYRLLIGVADGRLLNYSAEGKAVDGWAYEKGSRVICGDIKHFVIGGKDFISTVDTDGGIQFLARNGTVRYETEDPVLQDLGSREHTILAGKDIPSTRYYYQDADQRLVASYVNGELEVIGSDVVYKASRAKEYLVHSAEQTLRYDLQGNQLLKSDHLVGASSAESLGLGYLGVVSSDQGLYHLYDKEGALVPGFPKLGKAGIVSDLDNDNEAELLLWDSNSISLFQISQ